MRTKLQVLLLSSALLAGCATPFVAPIKKEVNSNDANAKTLMQQAQHGNGAIAGERKSDVDFVDALWLPTSRQDEIAAKTLSNTTLTREITENSDFRTVQDVADSITRATNIPVDVAADVTILNQQGSATGGANNIPRPTANIMPGGPLPTSLNSSTNGVQQQLIHIAYSGTVRGYLDTVATRFGVSWEWTNGRINFYRMTTRTFKIVALQGETAMQATVTNQSGNGNTSGSSGGAAAGGSSSSATTVTGATSTTGINYAGMSVWHDLENSIKGMLTKSGQIQGNVVVTPATHSVTVTDTPQIIARVRDFIEQQNQDLAKQVVVNVKVLSVDLNDGDEYGLNLNALYSSLSGNFGVGLSNSFTTGTGDSNLAFSVLGTSGTGVPGNPAVKAWQGTKAIISALSQQGHVSQVTSTSLMTLNGQAAPLQVGQETAYLASASTSLTANVGQTTTLTPGMFTTGFSMSIVPNIMDHGNLLLQYNINISSLVTLSQITSNGTTIQTPSIATRNFLQRVRLYSGDTLVLSGFEQNSSNATAQGVGSATNFAFGGGTDTSKTHSILVILIQPIVGDS